MAGVVDATHGLTAHPPPLAYRRVHPPEGLVTGGTLDYILADHQKEKRRSARISRVSPPDRQDPWAMRPTRQGLRNRLYMAS